MNISDDPEGKARLAAFRQSLEQLGWIDGRNVRIDTKWADGDVERIRRLATEMVAQSPDVILATGSAAAAPLLQATHCSDRVCEHPRSRRSRLCQKPCATGRQRYRLFTF
jgi:ABC-type uncharacterized transport system substrate-binding protein